MKKLSILAIFLIFSAVTNAEIITVTQVFKNASYNDYSFGSKEPTTSTGDWIFKGAIDNKALDQSSSLTDGIYYGATVTLTQASLGLFDVKINNLDSLLFGQYLDTGMHQAGNIIGFTNIKDSSLWTATRFNATETDNMYSWPAALNIDVNIFPKVSDITVNYSEINFNGFAPQWTGFKLENGMTIYGWGQGSSSVNASLEPIFKVPEPSTLALIGISAFGMVVAKRRRPL